MAITKLPSSGIGDSAVTAAKIADGAIQNQDISGSLTGTQLASTLDLSSKTVTLPNTSVTSDQLANSTIANNKLSNSTFTIRGTSRALGDSFSLNVNVDWQSVQTSGFTAAAGKGYFCNTTSASFTVTLPASATQGDTIVIIDYAGTFGTNNLTINRNGHNIQGVANNSLIQTNRASIELVYVDVTTGWIYAEQSNVADLQGPAFITATGGTITTSGDFKIHSFTGDDTFVVSTVGNISTVPTGGPGNVDYLVVAGGGGAFVAGYGSGGGGAGGYRTTFPSPGCNAGSFPISATTYPITVGAGGSGWPGSTKGSNSVFSTITSAGGGVGSSGTTAPPNSSGGSGGGGSGSYSGSAGSANPSGSGNTPPTSPSQGNNGGTGYQGGGPLHYGGGGGGGASTSGSNGSNGAGGPGGSGSSNSISSSPITYAGGGGGGVTSTSFNTPNFPGGSGGPGGGGQGSGPHGTGQQATAGTSNTGGGGGGGEGTDAGPTTPSTGWLGKAGGKGIVVIRYKFQ